MQRNSPFDQGLPADLDPSRGPNRGLSEFIGSVRDHHKGQGVTHVDYECHAPLANNVLADRHSLRDAHGDLSIRIIRHGAMLPGRAAVVIHITSAHRDAAYQPVDATEALKWTFRYEHRHYSDGSTAWLRL